VTDIRNAYLIGQADETQARGWLDAIGVAAADEQDGMMPIWNVMREVPQKRTHGRADQVKAYSRSYRRSVAALSCARRAGNCSGYTADDAATLTR
jgi:hypothetical protein